MALLLIEEAAEIGALLSLVEATGAQLVDAENIHQEIAGARRLVAGLASRGFRGLSLPEGDVVALIDRIIRDGRAAYGVATDDAARQEVVRAAAAAIFGICGQQPAPEAVERALSTVRARGRPRKGTSTSGTTGHYPLLIAVLRSIGFPETTLPASVKRTRGRSTERAHNRGGHQT
jgi:DNA-binding NarL/FixJ family response regulator